MKGLESTGVITVDEKFDLQSTIESGQTFLWNRAEGQMFDEEDCNAYVTSRTEKSGEVREICIEQINQNSIRWSSNMDDTSEYLRTVLGLKSQMSEIESDIVCRDTSGVMREAVSTYPGLRLVNEPLFPTIISFICSTQMRVERIHEMVESISSRYGSESDVVSRDAFPTPTQLSEATEEELKELKLGYRASYVVRTVEKIIDDPTYLQLPDDTAEARKRLMELTGVGTKVADCIVLYGAGRTDAVPVDTWIDEAAERYYPDVREDDRSQTARNFESLFGRNAGYAQMYLFHYMRMQD